MRRSLIGMAGTLLVLSTPSAQGAATRYAEPGGNGAAGPGQCLEADPCSLQEAVAGRVGQPNDA